MRVEVMSNEYPSLPPSLPVVPSLPPYLQEARILLLHALDLLHNLAIRNLAVRFQGAVGEGDGDVVAAAALMLLGGVGEGVCGVGSGRMSEGGRVGTINKHTTRCPIPSLLHPFILSSLGLACPLL